MGTDVLMLPKFGFVHSDSMMGTGISDQKDLSHPVDNKVNTDDENNQLAVSVQNQDPGMNAEVLKIPNVSDNQLVSDDGDILSSPFLVTITKETKKEVVNDKSLLQSPFLVKRESNTGLNDQSIFIKPSMFNLEDIFLESNFYPASKAYQTDRENPKKKESSIQSLLQLRPESTNTIKFR